MIFFLLPLLLNPLGTVLKWLPALYLAVWPIIIQTLGRDTLIAHALVLILFILTCDVSRQFMLKLIGTDLLSLPLGIALLGACLTEKGMLFLSLTTPIFGALLTAIEPVFLLIEIYLVMDMLRSFNKWLAEQANVRDEEAHDLSTWEPPLAKSAIVARIFVIVITILSYIGVYLVLQESKSWLGSGDDIPINFNHAIAALVTLQLIAVSATIYKEEGVLSESAMVALLATVPIFIASWSYYNLKETASSSHSTWTSYLPFSSIFAGSGGQAPLANQEHGRPMFDQNGRLLTADPSIERALDQLTGLGLDGVSRQLLSVILRRLIIIINSILGSSRDNLAKYYFGKDFWYTLIGRFVCLAWWALVWSKRSSSDREDEDGDAPPAISAPRVASFPLPLNKHTLIKLLLVLGYAQMLCQQMDNRAHLQEGTTGLAHLELPEPPAACCGGAAASADHQVLGAERRSELGAWFECMWTSARACSGATDSQEEPRTSRFARISQSLWQLGAATYQRLFQLGWFLRSLASVWLARWRSPIVQRLGQSILVQAYYIKTLLA